MVKSDRFYIYGNQQYVLWSPQFKLLLIHGGRLMREHASAVKYFCELQLDQDNLFD